MKLSGLHILLTYQCNLACDHCFVWGSPRQTGTFSIAKIKPVLEQAADAGVRWIFFEGGEPFLYYPVLKHGIETAHEMGFNTGIVTNAFWARTPEAALERLAPFAGRLDYLSISDDLYHSSQKTNTHALIACEAAGQLGIPVGVISIAQPEDSGAAASQGQIGTGSSAVMHRGRAAQELARYAKRTPFQDLTQCPYEDLRSPGRVHLDPFGYLHICDGIAIGNLFETPLREICDRYDPDAHPICGPLLNGGPAALVNRYNLPHKSSYAGACHLCDLARNDLRSRFPDVLAPDQMYGIVPAQPVRRRKASLTRIPEI